MIKFFKKIFCKIGWHSFFQGFDLVDVPDDPLNNHICDKYKCKWCGYVGMIDSQGNLF